MGGSSRNANSLTDFPELSDERQRRGTGFETGSGARAGTGFGGAALALLQELRLGRMLTARTAAC